MASQNKSGNLNSKEIRIIEQMIESVIRKRDQHYEKAKERKTTRQAKIHKATAEFYDCQMWMLKDYKRLKQKEISYAALRKEN